MGLERGDDWDLGVARQEVGEDDVAEGDAGDRGEEDAAEGPEQALPRAGGRGPVGGKNHVTKGSEEIWKYLVSMSSEKKEK